MYFKSKEILFQKSLNSQAVGRKYILAPALNHRYILSCPTFFTHKSKSTYRCSNL